MLDIELKQGEEVGSALRLISLKHLVPVDMKMLKVEKNIYWNNVSLMALVEGICFKRIITVKGYSALNKNVKLIGRITIGELIGVVVQSHTLISISVKSYGP